MQKGSFSLKARVKSLMHALHGLGELIRREHNAWIHVVVALAVILLGIWVGLSAQQWVDVVLAMGLVLSAEAMNTGMEALADLVSPEKSEKVRFIKDLAAGGVLIAALAAAITGMIVFLPRLLQLFF
ncbi:MAG TPA: diacylglycerol kinase family protein [Chitinophagaceae bacterium]|nr:diacylglycerol kinase family protein [Chitinophagaceae bacterium]